MNQLRDQAPSARALGSAALLVVDDALASASRREFFTSGQARDLLLRVHSVVEDASDAHERISGIVACADASFGDGALIDRCRLVDPLLDIRLAITVHDHGIDADEIHGFARDAASAAKL